MLLERFGRECGFRNLSEATFTEYVSIFMRTEELARIKAAYPELDDNSPELSAVRVLDICELSRAWAKEVVGKKIDNLKIETDPGQLVMSDVE
jgi:hypothetical protein